MSKRFQFFTEARRATVGYKAVIKVRDCRTGRIVLSSKASLEEFSTEAKARAFGDRAASVVAWNMNAAEDARAARNHYRVRPC
jgi:hypothetical protein